MADARATVLPWPLEPDRVARASFSHSFRGFDPTEVRSFLARLAGELAALRAREAELSARVSELEHRRPATPANLDERQLTELLGAEAARVLDAAREAATAIRANADRHAGELLEEARAEVEQQRAGAASYVDQRRAEADAEAARRVEEAEVEAERLTRQAQAMLEDAARQAEERLDAAREDGRRMVAEARAVRERILSDMARRRNHARQQLEKLRAGRERLLDAIEAVRALAEEAGGELNGSLVEARLAGERAGRQVDVDAVPPLHELEAEVDVAKDAGLIDLAAIERELSAGGAVDAAAEEPEVGVAGGRARADESAAPSEGPQPGEGQPVPPVGDLEGEETDAVALVWADEPAAEKPGADKAMAEESGAAEPARISPSVAADGAASDADAAAGAKGYGAVPFAPDTDRRPPPEPGTEDAPDTTAVTTVLADQPEVAEDAASSGRGPSESEPRSEADAVGAGAAGEPIARGEDDGGGAPAERGDGSAERPDGRAGRDRSGAEGGDGSGGRRDGVDPTTAGRSAGGDDHAESPSEPDVPSRGARERTRGRPEPVRPAAKGAPATRSRAAAPASRRKRSTPARPAEFSDAVDDVFSRIKAAPDAAGPTPAGTTEPAPVAGSEPAPRETARPAPVAGSEPAPAETARPAPPGTSEASRIGAERVLQATPAEAGKAAPVEASGAGPAGAGPAGAGPAGAERAALHTRDAMLAGITRDLVRQLKLALSDEQNELLDLVRAAGGGRIRGDDLPGGEPAAARYRTVARRELAAAFAAGWQVALGPAEPDGVPPGPVQQAPTEAAELDAVVDELVTALTAPVRERLADLAGGDVDHPEEQVRNLYRETRNHRVAAAAEHAALAAHAAGQLTGLRRSGDSVEGGGPAEVRWVFEACTPDCLDNSLAGPVPAGQAFPTGHLRPPAFPGCRCLLFGTAPKPTPRGPVTTTAV